MPAHRKMREDSVILDDFIIVDVMARHDEPQSAPSQGNRENQSSFREENKGRFCLYVFGYSCFNGHRR